MKVIEMKTNQNTITAAFVLFAAFLNCQPLLKWGQKIPGPSFDFVHALACDKLGNIYLTGSFQDNLNAPTGVITSKGYGDVFLTKMNASGNTLWTYGFGGTLMDKARAITINAHNEIITAGSFDGEADFDPTATEYRLGTAGKQNIYISKLTENAALIWSKNISSIDNITCNNVGTDDEGNIYLTGSFKGTVDFDPGATINNISATKDKRDMYVLKLNSTGDFVWVKNVAVNCDDSGKSFAVDRLGNVYVSGSFYNLNPVVFGSSGTTMLKTPSCMEDLFLMKLSPEGECDWVNLLQGTFFNGRSSLVLDDTGGNIFITGNFTGSIDLDTKGSGYKLTSVNASTDVFVSQFTSVGDFVWAKQIGAQGHEEAGNICVQKDGNILITGIYNGSFDCDPGVQIFELNRSEGFDIFLLSLNSSGQFICAGNVGGTDTDRPASLFIDNNDNIIFSGYFSQNVDLDPGSSTYKLVSENQSVFVSKLNTCSEVTELTEQQGSTSTKVYPNPAGQYFIINSDENLDASFYDAFGHVVSVHRIRSGENLIETSTLSRGVYILVLLDKSGNTTYTKIILQ